MCIIDRNLRCILYELLGYAQNDSIRNMILKTLNKSALNTFFCVIKLKHATPLIIL